MQLEPLLNIYQPCPGLFKATEVHNLIRSMPAMQWKGTPGYGSIKANTNHFTQEVLVNDPDLDNTAPATVSSTLLTMTTFHFFFYHGKATFLRQLLLPAFTICNWNIAFHIRLTDTSLDDHVYTCKDFQLSFGNFARYNSRSMLHAFDHSSPESHYKNLLPTQSAPYHRNTQRGWRIFDSTFGTASLMKLKRFPPPKNYGIV